MPSGRTGLRALLVVVATMGLVAPALAGRAEEAPPGTTTTAPETAPAETTPTPDKAPPATSTAPKKQKTTTSGAAKTKPSATVPTRTTPASPPVVQPPIVAPTHSANATARPATSATKAKAAAKAKAKAAAKAKAKAAAKAKAKARAKAKALARARARARAAAKPKTGAVTRPLRPREPLTVVGSAPAASFVSAGGDRSDLRVVSLVAGSLAVALLVLAVAGVPAARAMAARHPGAAIALDDRRTEIAVAAVSLLVGLTILAALSRWVI